MGVYAGPANAWSNFTDENRIDASTKVVVQDGLVLNLDAGASTSYPGSGTTWTDLSGNGNNASMVGTPTFNSEGYFTFANSDQYFRIVDNPDFLFGTNNFTLSAWSWFNDTGINTPVWSITSIGEGFSNSNFQFRDGNFNRNTTTIVNQTLDSNTTNRWINWCVTRIGNNYTLYNNGVSVSTGTDASNFTDNYYFKIASNRGSNNVLNGRIANVLVYNGKGLTASEVEQNFNALRTRFGI